MRRNNNTVRSCFFDPKAHTAFLIVCPIVVAIAAGVFALAFSITYDYLTAPYHADVEATLTEITQGETEKWEYIEGKDEARTPNERATRTYRESVYGYHWEYTIDGRTHTYETTSSSGTEHNIGDVKTMHFWSYDGEEYYRSYQTGLNYLLMALSAAVALAALVIIVRIIIIKIHTARAKKQKERRREEAQSHPNASLLNLGNYGGRRVRITEANGEVFEGVAAYHNRDYCEHAFGRREPCLQIANFTFFRSDVKAVETIRGQFAAPFGRIEELNFQDGIDSIEDELFCGEDESVYRMLCCIEAHAAAQKETCPGLSELLEKLLETGLTEQTRLKAENLLKTI